MTDRMIRGFTLIELMVVVLIIAVLAGIAFASYTGLMQRSRRSEALAALNEQQLRIEKHRVDNASYDTYTVPASADTPFYNISRGSSSASSYRLTAQPLGVQAADDCGTLVLSYDDGVVEKTADANNCW